jgi:hypothetical protein
MIAVVILTRLGFLARSLVGYSPVKQVEHPNDNNREKRRQEEMQKNVRFISNTERIDNNSNRKQDERAVGRCEKKRGESSDQ